jgi:hypothetical protein
MKKIKDILNPSLKNLDDRNRSVSAHFACIIEELDRKHRCVCVENIILMEVLVAPIKTYLNSFFLNKSSRNITLVSLYTCMLHCRTLYGYNK